MDKEEHLIMHCIKFKKFKKVFFEIILLTNMNKCVIQILSFDQLIKIICFSFVLFIRKKNKREIKKRQKQVEKIFNTSPSISIKKTELCFEKRIFICREYLLFIHSLRLKTLHCFRCLTLCRPLSYACVIIIFIIIVVF